MRTTAHIARSFGRVGLDDAALDDLFAHDADDVVSVEHDPVPGDDETTAGVGALHAKNERWFARHGVVEHRVEGPWVHGARCALRFVYPATRRDAPERTIRRDELGGVLIEDGRTIREEFFARV